MDNLEKILNTQKKNKLGVMANFKIQFRLRKLMVFGYLRNFSNFKPEINQILFQRGLAVAIFVLLALSGTSIYAYASSDILPGDRFYPLKIAVEKIEQKVAPTSAVKIKVYEKHTNRRLEEAVNLSEQKNKASVEKEKKEAASQNIKKNIDTVVNNQQQIVDSINNLNSIDQAVKSVSDAKKVDKTKTKYLDQIIDYARDNQDEETMQKAEQARTKINNQKYKFKDKELKSNNNNKEEKMRAIEVTATTTEIENIPAEQVNSKAKDDSRKKNK